MSTLGDADRKAALIEARRAHEDADPKHLDVDVSWTDDELLQVYIEIRVDEIICNEW